MSQEYYCLEISKLIASILGLDFRPNQWDEMLRKIVAAAKELNIDTDIKSLHQWLTQKSFTNIETSTLSGHLTINETYFFREMIALELFKTEIIPTLIRERRGINEKIKIWSAGCSSGEEPYTLAMILKDHFPELTNWDITIMATDISPNAIQKALQGEYTEWSFRNTNLDIKNKHFSASGRNWRIDPEFKKMIAFSYLNLSKSSYPSSITNTEMVDVIFCRNVMMYFTPEVITEVSARFNDCIVDNGWLITSQVELNDTYFSNFERVNYSGGIFYRKVNKAKVFGKPQPDFTQNVNQQNAVLQYVVPKYAAQNTIAKEKLKRQFEKFEPKTTIQKNDEKKRTWVLKPDHHFREGDYKECIESCLLSIAKGELTTELFSYLIKSYANLGLLNDDQNVLNQIFKSNAVTADMYYVYASLLKERNDLKQTEINLRKAIYLNHNHLLSHLMLGDIFMKTDKTHLATKHYENIIRIVEQLNEDDIVPESDGLTVRGIKEFTESIIEKL